MHKSRRASFNRSLHFCYSPKNEKTSSENHENEGTCNLCWIDYTVSEGLFRLPVMRYLLSEKRWTDKRWFDLVVVTALFLLYPIIKIKRVMISHTATMTSQISESEKEDRSSMKIVIIESPLSLCGMHKSRRASFNRSLHLCYSPKNEKTSFENEK